MNDDYDPAALATVIGGFYRQPQAELAVAALKAALRSGNLATDPPLGLIFVRIAEFYPAVRSAFETFRGELTEAEQPLLNLILNPPETYRNANYLPTNPATPPELDMCWSEFLVTGDPSVVESIVGVLDWDDRLRELADKALAAPVDSPDVLQMSATEWLGLRELGILIGATADKPTPHIVVPGDIDLLAWQGLQKQMPACTSLFNQLTEEQILHVATKGAAFWSLSSNAQQHPPVAQLCEKASKIQGGAGRQYLGATTPADS